MTRICFALGTWQIVTLAAGLRQQRADTNEQPSDDILVLYEPAGASDALQSAMQSVAHAVWPWKRIVGAFDLLVSPRKRIGYRQKRFDALVDQLRERIGVAERAAGALWLCWLARPPEKLILEAYPDARVVLYEDGLTTYLPMVAGRESEGLFARLVTHRLDAHRPVRRFRRHKAKLAPRHAARLSSLYLVLADVAPVPEAFAHAPCHGVTDRALRETLGAGAEALDSEMAPAVKIPNGRPRALLLGQSLYRWKVLSRAQELAIYRQVVDTLLAKGYDVLWKEHPRIEAPFFPDLADGEARVQELDLPFALPVELVAGRLDLSACVAGISAALFYLPRLHGVPAFTFADALAPFLMGKWVLQNDLVRHAVPSLDMLPAVARPCAPSSTGE